MEHSQQLTAARDQGCKPLLMRIGQGAQLAQVIGQPTQSVDLVSPYFVPTEAGVAAFAQLRARRRGARADQCARSHRWGRGARRLCQINTELDFVLESPAQAQQIPQASYRVLLDDQGRLEWRSGVDQPPAVYHQEPGTHWLKRGWLPIEWLLCSQRENAMDGLENIRNVMKRIMPSWELSKYQTHCMTACAPRARH